MRQDGVVGAPGGMAAQNQGKEGTKLHGLGWLGAGVTRGGFWCDGNQGWEKESNGVGKWGDTTSSWNSVTQKPRSRDASGSGYLVSRRWRFSVSRRSASGNGVEKSGDAIFGPYNTKS